MDVSNCQARQRIVVSRGDGIGPEITDAVLKIFQAAEVPLDYDFVELGESVFLKGVSAGVTPEVIAKIRDTGVLLKGPVTTPLGSGYKSVNVTLRKSLGLFANVRPCNSYAPYVPSNFPKLDVVIVRENEEDLYAGIEHQQTDEVVQVLKLLTVPGSRRIVRYAFEYARAYGRKRVTCITKDNIMKLTDGMFHRVFTEIAKEYPNIQSDHVIVDIGAARLASRPESFDVIVTLNLYGDIISDIVAEVAGSVGLAGSANVGTDAAMFEAIHGSAPDIAGKGIANPSGMLQAGIQMLVHLGLNQHAQLIKNAWLRTIEEGIHTGDIFREGNSRERVSTAQFAEGVISRLGQEPSYFKPERLSAVQFKIPLEYSSKSEKSLVGVDVFLHWTGEGEEGRDPERFGKALKEISTPSLHLKMLSNRGMKVYPDYSAKTYCADHWRCRFSAGSGSVQYQEVLELLAKLDGAGYQVIKTENLYTFNGKAGFSLGQGE